MIREAAAAGLYYPAEPRRLAQAVDDLLAATERETRNGLRGLVAPHAGYEYSGAVAASAFALVPRSTRVALLGPSHFIPFDGIAVSSAAAWETPLGEVPVSADLRNAALDAGAVVDDAPHARDHALEVELPFLQRACPDGFEVLPVAVGRATAEDVAAFIAALDVLTIVSTDLSHYHDDATARRLDCETAEAVVGRAPDAIAQSGACGVFALRGVVEYGRRRDLVVELVDLRTSADTAGQLDRVVGYGAFAFYE